jgi:hypothetical protein
VSLAALTPREASIFACFCDTVVAPEPVLPPVRDTDAVAFFDSWLSRSPRLNRAGLRAALYVAELSPWVLGFRRRMRRLDPAERGRALDALEHAPALQLRQLAKLLKGMAFLSYYGDDAIMRRLGYDPDERLRRARELRAREGRP